ncbi:MAG: hypothetical protein AAGF11_36095 [Myxococcota bacterium]
MANWSVAIDACAGHIRVDARWQSATVDTGVRFCITKQRTCSATAGVIVCTLHASADAILYLTNRRIAVAYQVIDTPNLAQIINTHFADTLIAITIFDANHAASIEAHRSRRVEICAGIIGVDFPITNNRAVIRACTVYFVAKRSICDTRRITQRSSCRSLETLRTSQSIAIVGIVIWITDIEFLQTA